MTTQKNYLAQHLTVLSASLIACLAVPLYMMAQSPEDFDFMVLSTFLTSGILLAILFFFILSLILVILYLFRLFKIANYFSLFVIIWIVLAGFILPLPVSTSMVEPEHNLTDKMNFIIVFFLTISLTVFASRVSKKATLWFLAIIVVGSVVPSLLTLYKHLDVVDVSAKTASSKNFNDVLSNKKNILVVSFDGMPGRVVADLIKKDPGISEVFKDFTFFENAISQAPVTKLSLMGEIYGIRDYKSIGKDHVGVFRELEQQGLNEQLLTHKVADSYQYGYAFIDTKRLPIRRVGAVYRKQRETIAFFRYPFVRLATSPALSLLELPWDFVENWLINFLDFSALDSKMSNLNQHQGRNWDIKNILKIFEFRSWVDGLGVGDKEFSVRFLHFTFTHFPVDLDSSCTYRSYDAEWYRNSQSEDGVSAQSACAFSLLSGFINKLKKLGVYEDSLIVFKSDHGEPPYFYSEGPDNFLINGHKIFGYNRYRPMLMIKGFNSTQQSITFNNDLVLLNDLAKTLCINSGLDMHCDQFSGLDLLGNDLKSDDPYFIYVVKNAKSSVKFETYISVKIPSRNIDFLDALKASPLITLSPSD